MRKQELIHLHGLLATVRDFCEEDLGQTVEREQYSELPIQPTSIHKSKADHQEAVAALADDIVDGLETDAVTTRETDPATAD
jgi:Predicted metal-binding protein